MDRKAVIECMARGLCNRGFDFDSPAKPALEPRWRIYMTDAESALTALEAAGFQVVPVEPGEWVWSDKVQGHDSIADSKKRMVALYRAMLAAAKE